jgi:CO/xanthine dehydrogenase FAD-binding subunit
VVACTRGTADTAAPTAAGRRRAGDFAVVGVACVAEPDEDRRVGHVRLVATGVDVSPRRLHDAEAALVGRQLDDDTVAAAASAAAAEIEPRGDANATPEHRREITAALVGRAIREVTRESRSTLRCRSCRSRCPSSASRSSTWCRRARRQRD